MFKFNVEGEEITIPLRGDDNDGDVKAAQPSCETAQRVLVAKDSGLVSDDAYHELRMSLPEDQQAALRKKFCTHLVNNSCSA